MKIPLATVAPVLAASLAALSLGLDVGMISSTLVQPNFISYFNNPTASAIGGVVASFSAGATFGSFMCAWIADRYGRVKSLFIGALIVILGCALQAGAVNIGMLIVGRLVNGFGAGQLTATFPVYASEMAPAAIRGALGGLQMVMIFTAIFIATATGYGFGINFTTSIQWRGPLIVQAIPPVLLLVACFFIPETPRFLVTKGKTDRAQQVLGRLHAAEGPEFCQKEFQEITDQIAAEKAEVKPTWAEIFRRPAWRRRMWLTMGLQIFGQLTGINCIQYYAATIYKQLGFSTYKALQLNLVYGAFGLIFALFWLFTIDKFGRKPLLIISSIMCGLALLVQSILSSRFAGKEPVNTNALNAQVAMFYVFNLFFTAPGMIAWLMPPEMLPMSIRAKGNSISVSMNNIAGLVVAEVSPIALQAIGFKFFYVFFVCDVIAAIVYWRFYPETKGISLEQMNKIFGDEIVDLDHTNRNPELGLTKLGNVGEHIESLEGK